MERKAFLYSPTELFTKKLAQVKRTDPGNYKRIMTVIDRLLVEPNQSDGIMAGGHRGRLKKYVGRRDYRSIYYWGELCRKENKRLEQQCADCDVIPDHSVIFIDLYHKKDFKKFKKTHQET